MQSNSAELAAFLSRTGTLAVLSGAGISTGSGIPDYRDHNGDWKHSQPMQFNEFVRSGRSRKRYWARSYVGWQRFSGAKPNAGHHALAGLEASGKVDTLITQNVDRLHQAAGSDQVIDLHGELSRIRCVDCDMTRARAGFQADLKARNPAWHSAVSEFKPDGDAELAAGSHGDFVVPDCGHCGGIVKPDVVMFGEAVPKERVEQALDAVERADALLVVGSSLMVFSGFRFARHAQKLRKPIVIVNQGRTRADDMAALKLEADCSEVLPRIHESLMSI
ncbi:MAG: NAD-dependent protein deacetylase [Woeseiaceae bacterium]